MMGTLHDIMEEINRFGVSGILALQEALPGYDKVWHAITEIGNSSHSFTLLIPLAAALDLQLACNLLVVCIMGEWSSTLLKWMFMEGRPYWWVRETDIYEKRGLTTPLLSQTTHTCETGAGSPSGHVMHTAVMGYVIVQWLIAKYASRSKFPRPGATRVRNILWTCFAILLILQSLSRMYIAAHFPHQCVLGAMFGIPLAWALTSENSSLCRWWKSVGRGPLVGIAALLIILAFGGYWGQKALGIDPQWSVKLAFKWCHSHQNLHVSTTNVFSLVRDCGSAFGFAIACPHLGRPRNKRISISLGMLLALLLNVAVRTAQKAIPTSSVITFYSAHFFLHAALPLVLLAFPQSTKSNRVETNGQSSRNRTPFRQKYE